MSNNNNPTPPPNAVANPFAGQLPAPRDFHVVLSLDNNGQLVSMEMRVQSLDHIGALARIAAELNDRVPLRVMSMQLRDVTGTKIITPGFAAPPPRG